MRKPKNWKGAEPVGDDWQRVGIVDLDGAEWGVSLGPKKGGWNKLKVWASNGTAQFKGNYHGGWDGDRLARTRDFGLMAENRPKLLEAVTALMSAQLRAMGEA